MKRIFSIFALGLTIGLTMGLSGCSSSYDDVRSAGAGTPPAAPAGQTDFTNFVVAQYGTAATSETASPVDSDPITFTFADNDNTDAFNSIIATAP